LGQGLYLASNLTSRESFFRQQLTCVAIPGFDQSKQKVLIPDVSVTKLVSFSFCQNQRLAGCLTRRQVMRQRVWFAPREVGADYVTNLFFRNPFHGPANQDWSIQRSQQNVLGVDF
jgi:hypothetical protein